MLCLSVQQPWAFLLVNGYKDVENRGWSTRHRGKLLIHASRTMDPVGYDQARRLRAKGLSVWLPRDPKELVLGAVCGMVEVAGCTRGVSSPWHAEGQWGWYVDRSKSVAFEVPTFWRGELKLFEVPVGDLWLLGAGEREKVED